MNNLSTKNLSILLAGEAGQGIQTIEVILTKILKQAGLNVFATKEYMSRVRGGTNSTQIRIGSHPIASFVQKADIFLPLEQKAFQRLKNSLTKETIIIGDKEKLLLQENIIDIPLSKITATLGNVIFANTIAVSFLAGFLNIEKNICISVVKKHFETKGAEIVEQNLNAAALGCDLGQKAAKEHSIDISFEKHESIQNDILLTGAEAIALGCICGGCNFISSYPMSPSTGVLTFLAKHAEKFGIVVEQAEDEISAINMGLGSWYAGGRAMVATSKALLPQINAS